MHVGYADIPYMGSHGTKDYAPETNYLVTAGPVSNFGTFQSQQSVNDSDSCKIR